MRNFYGITIRTTLAAIGCVSLALFLLMQAARADDRKGRINPSETIEAQLNPPAAVRQVLSACGDCHTETTHWRWYSNVAPFLWLQVADVSSGRLHMDLSRWARYTPAQQDDRLKGMCKLVREGDMPLWYYKPMHPIAWHDSLNWQALCQWTDQQRARLGVAGAGGR